ncbi:MAG: hypothetical protein MUE41_06250, partial [Gemmatimonadaceae bacterium]|nr:hypothetical protein [Gemmatimonadaceae bacterium]
MTTSVSVLGCPAGARRCTRWRRLGAALALLAGSAARAQPTADASAPPMPTIREGRGLRLDGRLDEPAWARADSITDFTQRDPREGAPASERTVVRVLATAGGLFIGVWAGDREPAAIRRAQLRRDADLSTD